MHYRILAIWNVLELSVSAHTTNRKLAGQQVKNVAFLFQAVRHLMTDPGINNDTRNKIANDLPADEN
jgi:hypothetical protein